jgi:hypothetical protein
METEEENPWFGNLTVWIVMCICRKSKYWQSYLLHKGHLCKKVANVCRHKVVCGTLLEHLEERTVLFFN